MNYYTLKKGASKTIPMTFIIDDALGATVDTVSWATTCGTAVITITEEALVDNRTTARITANAIGCATIAITANLSNSDIDLGYIKINVVGPDC